MKIAVFSLKIPVFLYKNPDWFDLSYTTFLESSLRAEGGTA